MKVRIKLTENHIFIGLICLIFLVGVYTLVKKPIKSSVAENRTLAQFEWFTLSSFLDGSFQSNFENALSDQFVKSEKIRTTYGEVVNNLPVLGIDKLICKNRYVYLDGKQYTNTFFDCDDYIVPPPQSKDPIYSQFLSSGLIERNIKKYNHVNSLIDTYYYFVEGPESFDFETGERVIDLEKTLRGSLQGYKSIESLQIDNYEDYKKYYYKTDHHWNYVGSYQGYSDIAKMFGLEPAQPIGTVTNHESFFGSKARDSRNYDFNEEFVVYKFDTPAHDTYVNREKKEYGHFSDFENHNYKYKKNTNYYGWVYGGDYGEVVFDYHQPEKENILIISNSFDNAIDVLIAQHFNKTYAVDLRHYQDHLKEKFIIGDYIQDNDIDKVLFIIQPRFITHEKSNQGLEL